MSFKPAGTQKLLGWGIFLPAGALVGAVFFLYASMSGGKYNPNRVWEVLNGVSRLRQTSSCAAAGGGEGDVCLLVEDGRAALLPDSCREMTECTALWTSPADWRVSQGLWGDLNQDGELEAVLLVWRPYRPWPVDSLLTGKGRTAEFHDRQGFSSHIILIGLHRGEYDERWAGSALPIGVVRIAIRDVNQDGWQDLLALESRYENRLRFPADGFSVWTWNGFGFDLLTHRSGLWLNFPEKIDLEISEGSER